MVTMSSADNALKTLYLGVIAEQINTNTNPLLAKIKQTTSDVWGKEIKRLAQYGINGGVGAGSETGSLPTAGGNNYEQFTLTLKNLYGTIELSDKAIRASENNAGAFVNLLNAEMEGLIKASSFNFGRMLYGDGSGVLSQVHEIDANGAITVFHTKNLVEGMIIDFLDHKSGEPISGATARRITSVDRANNIITVSGSKLTNELIPASTMITIQNSYNKEITGLGAIFKTTGNLYGLSRQTHKWLNPYIQENVGNLDEMAIQTAIDNIEETSGGKINFILCSAGVKRTFIKNLMTYRRNTEMMELEGGYKTLSYNGIPIVSDRFCPDSTMYLLNTDDFVLHQLCDWKWLESEDGKILKQIAGTPTYSATLVKYADLICTKPCGQGILKDIDEN